MRDKKPSLSLVTYNDPRITNTRKALDELRKLFEGAARAAVPRGGHDDSGEYRVGSARSIW